MEEWNELCDVVLAAFIKKEKNRQEVAKALWKWSNRDTEHAKYLLFEIFADYLTNPKLNDIFHRLQNREIGWDHPELCPIKNRFDEVDNFLICPPEVEEGVIECNKCGSKKTFSFSKQTRRADESATVFVRCANCNAAFRL